jgi:hypothetical protein
MGGQSKDLEFNTMEFKKFVSVEEILDKFVHNFDNDRHIDCDYTKKCLDSEEIINKFYNELSIIFLGVWSKPTEQSEIDSYKRQLVCAAVEANTTSAQHMHRALHRARDYPITNKTNFPNINQVINWMKPETFDYAITPLSEAYKEACNKSHPSETNKSFSHPVVHYAWIQTGAAKIGKRTERNENEIKRIFSYYYNLGVRLFIEKGASAVVSEQQRMGIEHATKTGINPEFKLYNSHDKAMEAISKILGTKK